MSVVALVFMPVAGLLAAPPSPAGASTCTITGTAGGDVLIGTSGNDVICGLGGNDFIFGMGGDDVFDAGDGDDTMIGGTGSDQFLGGNGTDIVWNSTRSDDLTIDLDAGTGSSATVLTEHDTYDSIENLTDGSGDDTITGTIGANKFIDVGGDDHIDGGSGTDTVDYELRSNPVTVDLANNVGGEAGESDHYTSIENAIGGSAADLFVSPIGDNVFDGGNGNDTVSYAGRTTNIVADLSVGSGGESGESDTYVAIENLTAGNGGSTLTGTSTANKLTGGTGVDTLNGGGGSDTLDGGNGGGDVIDGGTGNNKLVFNSVTTSVNVTLNGSSTGTAVIAGGATESITKIQNVTGTAGNDTITGDGNDNTLVGGDGTDHLLGGAGNDTLQGGDGSDTLNAGTGADTLDDSDQNGGFTVDLTAMTSSIDAISGTFVNVQGGGGLDTITGTSGANTITGGNGNDVINSGAGNDTITGGAGNDTINGGDGDDVIDGGVGSDALDGGNGTDTLKDKTQSVASTIDLGAGTSSIDSSVANFENAQLGDGDDTITGTNGANVIDSGAGNDTIHGLLGNDTLTGGDGNDTIYGGDGTGLTADGNDTITGGDGTDYGNGEQGTNVCSADTETQVNC